MSRRTVVEGPEIRAWPACPIERMNRWLEARGFKSVLGSDGGLWAVTQKWAEVCQRFFFARQPQLADQIWDDVWTGIPFHGDTIWLVTVKAVESHGMIHLPDKQSLREGWVLSVGWGICDDNLRMGRRSPFPEPLDLVGQRVSFGAYAGRDLLAGALGIPELTDSEGNPTPLRNRPRAAQYWELAVSDLSILSNVQGGTVL